MLQLKLLVVEDDAASLELMTEVFESLKADVRPVSDSEEAARRVNQEKFDGIFLDLEMPRMHGFDLARWIAGQPIRSPITPPRSSRTDPASLLARCAAGPSPINRRLLRSALRLTMRNNSFGTISRKLDKLRRNFFSAPRRRSFRRRCPRRLRSRTSNSSTKSVRNSPS